MKAFVMHWMDGHNETIWGDSIEEAVKNAGINNGAMRVLDYWEEIDNISLDQHLFFSDGKQIYNPTFIDKMKSAIKDGLKMGETVFIDFYKGFTFRYINDTGLIFNFEQV